MLPAVVARILELAREHRDLADSIPPGAYGETLGTRSNTIGAQFWCVVGARESYTRALASGSWQGFSCSLDGDASHDPARVVEAMSRTEREFEAAVALVDEWTNDRVVLLLDLLTHEAQHHGQLIRYGYALDLAFPKSWMHRWALE